MKLAREHYALIKLTAQDECDRDRRPQLTGIEFRDGKATATDSYVLGQLPAHTDDEPIVIPDYALKRLQTTLGSWTIEADGNDGAQATRGEEKAYVEVIGPELAFPKHEIVWPQESKVEITVDIHHLKRIVEFMEGTGKAATLTLNGPTDPIQFIGLRYKFTDLVPNGVKALLMPVHPRAVEKEREPSPYHSGDTVGGQAGANSPAEKEAGE